MNYIDIAIAVPIIFGLVRGFMKGFVIELAALVALALGIYCALHFSDMLCELAQEQWDLSIEYMPIIAFALIFIAVVFLVRLLAKLVEKALKLAALGIVNRFAGALLGGLKFAFVLSSILYLLNALSLGSSLEKLGGEKESVLLEPTKKIAPTLIPIFKDFKGRWLVKEEK